MRNHAQAVVIGGGVIGCSILYHLTKLGWSDVVLLERDELTSGSTWHAAANVHGLHDSTNISRLQHYTMNLYKQLEAETGQGCGIFQPGSLYLAQTEARVHQLRLQAAKAKLYGMNFYEVSREEAQTLHPMVDYSGVKCIMFEPDGGNVDPSGVTAAFAAGARAAGADIHRFTPVVATEPTGEGKWIVHTHNGQLVTDWVINAAGLWGREVARLAGIELPLQPTEHQYFVTETVAEIAALDKRLPSVADRDGEYYLRQEGQGLLVGAYERDVRLWAENGTPLDFAHELFADDLDRIEDNVMRAMDRVPALASAGIKRVINGPMIWSPDSNVLLGPIPEKPGYFCCNGIIPGFSQAGGMGLMVAQWIVQGEMERDVFAWDVTRFGDWADASFTRARVRDQYAHRFKIHFPNEEREEGRPCRMRPAYDLQASMGAVFGLNAGWEHPLYFDTDQPDTAGFTRQGWWHSVNREVLMLRNYAGIIDISNFAKYQVQGPDAHAWLEAVFANRIPAEAGRSCLTPLIGKRGGIAGDFTVTCLDTDTYWFIGSGMAERFHNRFWQQVPMPKGTTFTSLTDTTCGFNIAGPKSRSILQQLTNHPLSYGDFGFMRSCQMTVAGIDVVALRVSFTGDLGWELHCAAEDQVALYQALIAEGSNHGAGPVGSRALMALRLEKGYGSWGREYSPENWPQEQGLDRLCRRDKTFLHAEEMAQVLDRPARETLVLLSIDLTDCAKSNADASGGEPIFKAGQGVGRITSGAYCAFVDQSLALGFLDAASGVQPGDDVDVMILGTPHRAKVLDRPPFDPQGQRLRG